MWEYVIGEGGIFWIVVGLFSVYNGRATRKVIIEGERRIQEILTEYRKLLEKLSKSLDGCRSSDVHL